MAVELLRQVAKAVEPCITTNGGRVVKRLGDGLTAVFDDPELAVAAALGALAAAADVAVGDHRAQIRAGVHLGRPRFIGGDYLGVDVNVAARVAAAAGPGRCWCPTSCAAHLPETVRTKRKLALLRQGHAGGHEGVPGRSTMLGG